MNHLIEALASEIGAARDELVDTRRWFHARPELSFDEHATSAALRSRMAALGLAELGCPTETGAVFALDGGLPGETVLLRADIDGLPVREERGLAFASLAEGRMHACGHDAHMAILLGVAGVLAGRAEALPGRYVFVFQPAEEQISGARAMIAGGLLDGLGATRALGCHVISSIPVGLVTTRPGISMAGGTGLRIGISGSGGHAALEPRRGNVVLAVSEIASRLGGVVEGISHEGTSGVCTPAMIHAGTAANIVPTAAEMHGTLRTFDAGQLASAKARLEEMVREVCSTFEVDGDVAYPINTGPVRNDPGAVSTVLAGAASVLGDGSVFTMPAPIAASDDMSEILERVPGCYLFVGAGAPDGSCGAHHSPGFAIDEGCLVVGARAIAAGAVALAG